MKSIRALNKLGRIGKRQYEEKTVEPKEVKARILAKLRTLVKIQERGGPRSTSKIVHRESEKRVHAVEVVKTGVKRKSISNAKYKLRTLQIRGGNPRRIKRAMDRLNLRIETEARRKARYS